MEQDAFQLMYLTAALTLVLVLPIVIGLIAVLRERE
jgi:uncharacterized membrane protein